MQPPVRNGSAVVLLTVPLPRFLSRDVLIAGKSETWWTSLHSRRSLVCITEVVRELHSKFLGFS
jgi:hypothetical protein